MRYIVAVNHYQHSPLPNFAEAFELFRAHVNASLTADVASCSKEDGYYLIVENDEDSALLGILEALNLGEEVGLFDTEGNIVLHPNLERLVREKLFPSDELPIHSLARALGIMPRH